MRAGNITVAYPTFNLYLTEVPGVSVQVYVVFYPEAEDEKL